jgi:hypothetical protein
MPHLLVTEQRARLRAIEDRATNEAQAVLIAEQQNKLRELSQSQSMMQCMHPLNHAGKSGCDMSVGCSHMQEKGEDVHSSH